MEGAFIPAKGTLNLSFKIIFICCVWVDGCVHMHMEVVGPFILLCVGPRYQTQVVRLGSKSLYRLSHLTSPVKIFFLLSSYFMYNSFSIYDENRLFLFILLVSMFSFLNWSQKEKKTNKNQALRAQVGFKEL